MTIEFPGFGKKGAKGDPKPGSKEHAQQKRAQEQEETRQFQDQIKLLANLSWEELDKPGRLEMLKAIPARIRDNFFYEAMRTGVGAEENLFRSADRLMEYLVRGKNEEVRQETWRILHGWAVEGNYVWHHYPQVVELARPGGVYVVTPAEELYEATRNFTEADIYKWPDKAGKKESQRVELPPPENFTELSLENVGEKDAIWVNTKNTTYLFMIKTSSKSSERYVYVVAGSEKVPKGTLAQLQDTSIRVGERFSSKTFATSVVESITLEREAF